MEKQELYDFLSKSLEGESMETVATALEKIRSEWVEEYRRQYFKGYARCKHCGCYSKHKEFVYQIVNAKEKLKHERSTDIYKVKRGLYFCPKCGKVADSIDLEWSLIETKEHQ